MRHALYFLYPKISQPGDFYGQRPVAEPARHRAHRARPLAGGGLASGRLAARALLRPALRRPAVADAADEVALLGQAGRAADLVRADAERQVRPAALRRPALREARRAHEPGLPGADRLPAARTRIPEGNDVKLPKGQLEEAPNLAQIDRSYWLSGNPLPVTEQNLLRGKQVFLERCVGCHGPQGDGKGPGAKFMSPPPADFTDKDDACCGGDTGPGDFYYRILRGWPGTGMENFGDRLSVDDIWRVVLFIKTIPNGTLRRRTSSPSRRTTSSGSRRRSCSPGSKTQQKLKDNASFDKKAVDRSVHAGGDARVPGPRAR